MCAAFGSHLSEEPIVHQNIKFSVQPATKEEAPNDQKCADVHNKWGYFFVRSGSAFVADVSYYSGIKRVTLNVSHFCSGASNPVAVFLYDLEGNLIERKEVSGNSGSGWQTVTFDKNLSNLKEIRFIDRCEGGINRLQLYDK